VLWDKKVAGKGGYDHFMLKEIHEQPRIIQDSLNDYQLKGPENTQPVLNSSLTDLLLLACGTSYHAALIGKYIIEEMLGILTRAEMGSEFNHRNRVIIPSTTIALTQSGETADILVPLRKLRQAQARTLVITNTFGCTAGRLADSVIYTSAGPEVSVAATKSFTAQLIELYKLVLSSGMLNPVISEALIEELRQMPSKAEQVFTKEKQIESCAEFLSRFNSVFFIGRGINYPIALEGALKLKEVSYLHADGFAAGELKHGPFALLDRNTPVIALVPRDNVYSPMVNNIKEIKARHSPVIGIVEEGDEGIESLVDMVIKVPRVPSIFTPIINVIPLQLISYYVAKIKGCPVDYPRNLAKSVTVE
jgi:glutamine---fructose-6-phosphate transaminase (isomerizing)